LLHDIYIAPIATALPAPVAGSWCCVLSWLQNVTDVNVSDIKLLCTLHLNGDIIDPYNPVM